MKKNFVRVGAGVASMFLALNTVCAEDLTTQIETSDAGLGNSIKFEKTYDSEKDLNKILVKLLADKNSINTVLNQKPGSGSELSIFYFSINPNLEAVNFKKAGIWYGDGLSRKTYEAAVADLVQATNNETKTNDDVIWMNALSVQYFDKENQEWKMSNTKGDNNTSIKDDLVKKLGLNDESELVYGENYRFSMYDQYTYVWRFDMLDDADNLVDHELVAVDWKIEFPVAGRVEDRQVLFATLEDAVNSNSKEIFINKDTVIDTDIVIPEDVTITVDENATLDVTNGVKLENNGTILGNVKIDGTNKVYSIVDVLDTKNGKVTVDKTNVSSGDTVTVSITANKDYKLESLKVIDKTTKKEIEIKDNKFVMPEADVEVSATFKAISKSNNPDTGDNIIIYIVTGILSFGAIILNSKLFKKIFN